MTVNLLGSGEPEHPARISGFHRTRAILRCLVDPEEQYKHWPPLFGTESYWRWQRVRSRPVPKTLQVAGWQPGLSAGRFSTMDWWMRSAATLRGWTQRDRRHGLTKQPVLLRVRSHQGEEGR